MQSSISERSFFAHHAFCINRLRFWCVITNPCHFSSIRPMLLSSPCVTNTNVLYIARTVTENRLGNEISVEILSIPFVSPHAAPTWWNVVQYVHFKMQQMQHSLNVMHYNIKNVNYIFDIILAILFEWIC